MTVCQRLSEWIYHLFTEPCYTGRLSVPENREQRVAASRRATVSASGGKWLPAPPRGWSDATPKPKPGETFFPVVRVNERGETIETFCSCRRMEAEEEGWRDNDANGWCIIVRPHGRGVCPTCGDRLAYEGEWPLPHVYPPADREVTA